MSSLINQISNLSSDFKTNDLLKSYGYCIQNISWEDTARNKGSCWGPNISDMTLRLKNGNRMPMIRKPNFSDVSYDVDINKFKVPVNGKIITLKEYIKDIAKYENNSNIQNLLLDRDEKILTQVQTCVLPCESKQNVEFSVNLYNYQSSSDSPAVLTITVSKHGTSTQILNGKDNNLYFNNNGESHYFKAERLGDVRSRRGESGEAVTDYKEMKSDEKLENCIMIFQIPLKQKQKPRHHFSTFGSVNGIQLQSCMTNFSPSDCLLLDDGEEEDCSDDDMGFDPFSNSNETINTNTRNFRKKEAKGFDMGNLSIGSNIGRYHGTQDMKLERDERFPIRCTYQYYRLTDLPDMSSDLIQNIVEQLNNINNIASSSGSLVHDTTDRITEPKNLKEGCFHLGINTVGVPNPNWQNNQMLAL